MAIINPNHIDEVLGQFRGRQFTTADFKSLFQSLYPDDWAILVNRYGDGGRGGGQYYSANCYLGHRLKDRERKGMISLVEFVSAPPLWGNDVIANWEY